ncbi:lysozyme [Synechococcus phage S-CRES3]|nr:lysozyme [Synechococcus phage S-CRES3]
MIELLLPLIGPVTQDPSPRHPAVDQACTLGAPVRAMSNGYGRFEWDHYKGWTFIQETPEGEIRISHLKHKGVDRFYNVGEVFSACGNTGAYSTGPHLHVEAPPHILQRVYYSF